jgi:hypothetical protein
MLGALEQILCWVKQFGALVLGALIEAFNSIVAGFVDVVNAIIIAWPIGMPDLPTMPSGLATAFGWLKWSPLPVDALLALMLFLVTVWLAMWVAGPILKWFKVAD